MKSFMLRSIMVGLFVAVTVRAQLDLPKKTKDTVQISDTKNVRLAESATTKEKQRSPLSVPPAAGLLQDTVFSDDMVTKFGSLAEKIKQNIVKQIFKYKKFDTEIKKNNFFNSMMIVPLRGISFKSIVTATGTVYYIKHELGDNCFVVKVVEDLAGKFSVQGVRGAFNCNLSVFFF